MDLTRYRDEMAGAIDTLRRRLATLWDDGDRCRAVREARRAVKHAHRQAKRLVHDRVTHRVPFPEMVNDRFTPAQRLLFQIEAALWTALTAINLLGSECPEAAALWIA